MTQTTNKTNYALVFSKSFPHRNLTIKKVTPVIVGKSVPSLKKFRAEYPAGTQLVRQATNEVVLQA